MRPIMFSRQFPKGHFREGQPTYFKEAIQGALYNMGVDLSDYIKYPESHMENNHWNRTPKLHTIRAGNRWKAGDWFSPRVWSDKPYRSPQIQFAPDMQVKKVYDIEIDENRIISIDGSYLFDQEELDSQYELIAKNDGLTVRDFNDWFNKLPFKGQIIVWDESINY